LTPRPPSQVEPGPTRGPWVCVAAVSGFLAVAIGAFGAHGLTDAQAKAWVETGSKYHLVHTMAIIAAWTVESWGGRAARHAPPFFIAGVMLFSGSLYGLAIGAPRWFGAIAPLGGLAFLAGWIMMLRAGLQIARAKGDDVRDHAHAADAPDRDQRD
jgi:uncharacterized membrane protein YgdD (TMEM256/DUF423 family)